MKIFSLQKLLLLSTVCVLAACEVRVEADAHDDENAANFVARVNDELAELRRESGAAEWVRSTYIILDTAIVAAKASEKYAAWHSATVADSLRYAREDLRPDVARALKLLTLSTSEPAPNDFAKRKELAALSTELGGLYGAGKYCPESSGEETCLSLGDLENVLAESRDYDKQLDAWRGWHTISIPMRAMYQRFVELTNEGARELNYADLGKMWKDNYDMSPAAFEAESLRLYNQVKPLYDALHCHVRAELAEHYGTDKVPLDGPIPAHLLGNMWAQEWGEIYDLLEPYPGVGDLDVDAALAAQNYTPVSMVESAEQFYESLGMPALPATFWERSMFKKPADREVVCHASAWGLDGGNDLRIKMCIEPAYEDLRVIYHELGHNYYQGAYRDQPPLFQTGAHGGFHEAIGDTITLSMTPGYLAEVGLIESAATSDEATINRQMQQALDKIAFLPFGKLIDEWRWNVFSGKTAPGDYNKAWWELRTRYQGIAPAGVRGEEFFDPGAKYHVPANVSYTRYFLARILQFQFQRSLCETAGHTGPLHECSIYGNKEAGARLLAMLEAGASQPWQDTLEKLTGTREMDATAIIDYFQPLMNWLEVRNRDRTCGW
ncbi:MAG: M2 family metallopeptidase [Woeseia sp.]|nr:M2 family metallopeptidase [Woeseia sp.]